MKTINLFLAGILMILGISIIIPLPVFGQTDQGRIAGTIADANGAIVPGASVSVKNEKTGEVRAATATEDGTFSIPLTDRNDSCVRGF